MALLLAVTAFAQTPPAGTVHRPAAAATGTVIVPDRFLRSWDPVTLFFDRDLGGSPGTPEDQPERLVTMTPAHPGAYTWLDARTLQFRPADPWSPLARFTFKVGAESFTLASLMAAPLATIPAADAQGLEPVESITLAFAEPIAPDDLERMVTIELRPLPGVGSGQERWLTGSDFEVKVMERASPSDNATYVLNLATPIPFGTRAIVHLRLSLDDTAAQSFADVAFATAEPFRVLAVGSRETRYPITPDGTRYTPEQALNCGSESRTVVVELSSPPAEVGPVAARNLVRFTPAVANLSYRTEGRTIEVDGDFSWDTVYRVTIASSDLRDQRGRPLEVRAPSDVYLYFPRRPQQLRWTAGQGVVEREGPRMVPVEGRGFERLDLRIHPVDPLDRSFWPFPQEPVTTDESSRPPGPGEAPEPFTEARAINQWELPERLAALGSPLVSTLVDLPLRKEGSAASFGLDLGPYLDRIAGSRAPGHYLVGLRALDTSSQRQWMRVQVTDLCLTTVEEPYAVRFVVTSLSTGKPVSGATVAVDAVKGEEWTTLVSGTTDAEGAFTWRPSECDTCLVSRIWVRSGDDVLVLDPTRPPDGFKDNSWSETYETWLQWAVGSLEERGPMPELVSHLFTERPVYRPEEPVHIKGYVRLRDRGHLALVPLQRAFVVVEGPGELVWRYPLELTVDGSFYHRFEEADRPTGEYRAHLEAVRVDNNEAFTSREVRFRLEAYRIPQFEVDLHAVDTASLDEPLKVTLTATYYAGGRVVDRPVAWRVTQFPYTWEPKGREGFLFSSDGRFSRTQRFDTTAALTREDRTDAAGGAVLELDPTREATAQPRTYVVEATVTGPDDQTVSATRRIVAVPAFVLGMKLPRYLEKAAALEPQVLAVGPDDKLLAGVPLTLRLLHRQWHSYLRASDFSDGQARYVTDVVDEKVSETSVTSGSEPITVKLPISGAGVWVVELEARDRVGRAQVVSVDLYAGGEEPVSWAKPTTKLLTVTTDKDRYDPGEQAHFVIASPFQSARLLVIVEAPDGNVYHWVDVVGGNATFTLPVDGSWSPSLPVHFVLLRGRVPGTKPVPGTTTDLGKPATMAATSWLTVNPRAQTLAVALEYPERSLPGKVVDVTVKLSDPDGAPLPGEVTLWLVDQAVLALGKEQRLDPLPDLVTPGSSHLEVRDTRHLPFGDLPFAEAPGGGEGEAEEGLLERTTVRRRFEPVPYYEPLLQVGPDGTLTVHVQLPDNLTNFKLRAKAVSGAERFGFAAGHLEVRLPVIVQPALPRFVRPGDRFTAAAIGRVVEGEGGPGAAEVAVEGLTLGGPARRDLTWVTDKPERIEFPVEVPTPTYDQEGKLTVTEAVVRVAVARSSDDARDAFEVKLPIRDDRRRLTVRKLADLVPGQAVELPPVEGEARPGTVRRSVLVSSQPALVRMAAGLSFLASYPFGCTEQRLSLARAHLAAQHFRDVLVLDTTEADFKRAVGDVMSWLPSVVDADGLVSYWPGSTGYVSLTAWTVEFLVEAKGAGFTVDDALLGKLTRSLEQALRSDYGRFIDGESFAERCWALVALARAGKFDSAYAAELARKAEFLNLESTAEVLLSFSLSDSGTAAARKELADRLWSGVVIRLWQGREMYGGLQEGRLSTRGLILPSETRALGEVTRAIARVAADDPRLQVMVDGLVNLGRDDGWGSTNANASALLALTEVLSAPKSDAPEQRVALRWANGQHQALTVSGPHPLAHVASSEPGAGEVELENAGAKPIVLRAESSWVPAADGSTVAAASAGFVVTRELLLISSDEKTPPKKLPLDSPAQRLTFSVGDVVEEHVQLVNPSERNYVALVVPLAAGMEPLNPNLATAPPEARPTGSLTLEPSYAAYLDDQVAFYYDTLPKGTYDFSFRLRATTAGRYIQPAAWAEMMYDGAVRGNGNGASVEVLPAAGE